jgi:hypothetical protein
MIPTHGRQCRDLVRAAAMIAQGSVVRPEVPYAVWPLTSGAGSNNLIRFISTLLQYERMGLTGCGDEHRQVSCHQLGTIRDTGGQVILQWSFSKRSLLKWARSLYGISAQPKARG